MPVRLRDGVTIHVDVFRPPGTEKVPVIVAWSPYGKGQGTSISVMGVFGLVGLDNGIVSGLEKFEGPDPAYWCAQGYAICNPDIRGVVDSEGDSVLWDRQEGRDCHDLVEWLAEQEWCNGKVGMSGTSYLAVVAVVHRRRAAPAPGRDQPVGGRQRRLPRPRDARRDAGHRRSPGMLQNGSFFGKNQKEDILAEAEQYPLMNELWEDKIPDFDRITVPAYVVASYSNTLHTAGTFRGWRRIASDRQVAAHPQQPGMARLLRRGQRRGPAPLLRPLPQGRGQRVGADAARSLLACSTSRAATGSTSRPTQFPPDGSRVDEVLPRRPHGAR